MVHILLLHILCLRSGIGMPVFMPDPWFIVVIIALKSAFVFMFISPFQGFTANSTLEEKILILALLN